MEQVQIRAEKGRGSARTRTMTYVLNGDDDDDSGSGGLVFSAGFGKERRGTARGPDVISQQASALLRRFHGTPVRHQAEKRR